MMRNAFTLLNVFKRISPTLQHIHVWQTRGLRTYVWSGVRIKWNEYCTLSWISDDLLLFILVLGSPADIIKSRWWSQLSISELSCGFVFKLWPNTKHAVSGSNRRYKRERGRAVYVVECVKVSCHEWDLGTSGGGKTRKLALITWFLPANKNGWIWNQRQPESPHSGEFKLRLAKLRLVMYVADCYSSDAPQQLQVGRFLAWLSSYGSFS